MYFINILKALLSRHSEKPSAAPTPSARYVMPRMARPPWYRPSIVTSYSLEFALTAFSRDFQERSSFSQPT